jgi:MerR family redox-sensitive transcriptional activator SoxR
MAEIPIGEVAQRSVLASSAIRYYESVGLLPRAGRRGGRRWYDESILLRISIIELAKRAGFRITEIRQLLAGFSRRTPPGVRWRRLADEKLRELEARIEEARRMQALLELVTRCECPSFDDCARAIDSPRG